MWDFFEYNNVPNFLTKILYRTEACYCKLVITDHFLSNSTSKYKYNNLPQHNENMLPNFFIQRKITFKFFLRVF